MMGAICGPYDWQDMIEILYSCDKCGAKDRKVPVRHRHPAEDVVAWMQGVVVPALGRDHDAKSPGCRITRLTNVKIPLPPGAEGIGDKPPTLH